MDSADIQRIKDLLPTTLGSEEIREAYAAQILRRSVHSARMAYMPYLERLRSVLVDYQAGSINQADATHALWERLGEMGHSHADGGGITNPASVRRLELILRTNRQMAASVAEVNSQDEDTVYMAPAWELTRTIGKSVPRTDWAERWRAAGESVGWEGAHRGDVALGGGEWSMVALKISPIWGALGAGAGGYRDAIGNPYPPFAWGSGLGWLDVDRDRCLEFGLVSGDEPASSLMPARIDLAPSDGELRAAIGEHAWARKVLEEEP